MTVARLAVIVAVAGLGGCSQQPATPGAAAHVIDEEPGADEVSALVARGEALFFGPAGCATCHKVGDRGDQIIGPNLGVGDDQRRPVTRRPGRPGPSHVAAIVDAIVDPDAWVVPGYARGVMKRPDAPPRSLTADEIASIALYVVATVDDAPLDAAMVETARRRVPIAAARRDARRAAAGPGARRD